ncbi:MAG: S-layer homology domain-containing protein, partial [Oscillospiraceae bacterium]
SYLLTIYGEGQQTTETNSFTFPMIDCEYGFMVTNNYTGNYNPEPTYYSLTVRWVDEDGNQLAAPVIRSIPAGSSYNAENYEGGSGRSFSNYTYSRTIGTVSGTMTGNTTISFVYKAVTIDIPDDIPLADLNTTDHFAYIVGRDDGLVHPEAGITRAEVATIFFRLLTDEARDSNLTTENDFSDVSPDNWFNTAISTLTSMGIITGYPDGTFRPNANITRAEFAAIAARFDSSGYTGVTVFLDTVGHWAEEPINRAANYGWITGYEDDTFRPNNYITRAEVATLVNKVLGRLPASVSALLPDMITWPDNMDTGKWYYLAIQEATNSHYYEKDSDGVYETWTELRETRDWTVYEK